jgi:hypothetical protein
MMFKKSLAGCVSVMTSVIESGVRTPLMLCELM